MARPVPLTAAERADLRERAAQRLAAVEELTADVFAFRQVERAPTVVNRAQYTVFGQAPDIIPEGQFTDPAVMTDFQERNQYEQLLDVEDAFMPYVMPWFGTAVVASALGCEVGFAPMQDPAADPAWFPVQTAADIRRLEVPDPRRAGLMPTVLDYLGFMRDNSALPVGITDCQGPLTTANQLMGYDKLIYLMYDDPRATHALMDVLTETLIMWVQTQKAVIGDATTFCIADQQVYTGPHAGVWFSDDDAVLMPANLYREFVVPYNSRLLSAFGGGIVHFCGKATQHADNFLATDGLLGLNIYALHDLAAVAELQRATRDRLVLFVCDYTAVDYGRYFDRLVDLLDPRGLVICSQYSPVVGLLDGGKYELLNRSRREGHVAVHDRLEQAMHSWAASQTRQDR